MWRWLISRRDEAETRTLLAVVTDLRARSNFQTSDDVQQFISELIIEVCDESDLCPSARVIGPMSAITEQLLAHEPFCADVASLSVDPNTLSEGAALRTYLRRAKRLLEREDRYLALWRAKLKLIWIEIVKTLPVNALVDPYPDGTAPREPILSPQTPLCTLIDDFPDLLQRFIGTFFDDEIAEPELFRVAREQIEGQLCAVSGIAWNERHTSSRPYILPAMQSDLPSAELAETYTEKTVFADFFTLPVPIPVPDDVRFEHTHIIGGTGHGKTQLLQYLINDDLNRAVERKQSVVVMDPDGSLLDTLSRLDLFDRARLGDRAIFIDPTDSERPVGLNLFDIAQMEGADRRAQETIENNTIELFEYFFDALLGSELTSRQATLFRYLGLLLMQIPGGNIHTLRELMEDGKPYRPYMRQLTGTARTFFETRFFDKSLNSTKQQILARLWGVLSNRALDRVFSATKNTVQLDQAMQDGKIIFINTSKEYLGEEGSHIFARMMVALLGQGLMRRAATPPAERTDTFIYLDEAEGVIDQTLIRLLAQVRKYRGAITIAHQHLDQLGADAKSGVAANTSIKLAGGVSAGDAGKLAAEYRVDSDFILAQRKAETETNFALFAKNVTPQAMPFSVPLGFVEGLDRLSHDEHAALMARSRQRYGLPLDQHPPTEPPASAAPPPDDGPQPSSGPSGAASSPPPAQEATPAAEPVAPPENAATPPPEPPPVYRKEGGGGARHREIEGLVKELGEAAGFRASVEEVILDGVGRVDVILRNRERTICVEVSVTTTKEHEYLNVQKCFSFGADEVWLVAHSERHATGLKKHIGPLLSETELGRFRVLTVDGLMELFADMGEPAEQAEHIVKGYRVRSNASSKQLLRQRIADAFSNTE